jgi:hypothetical protein
MSREWAIELGDIVDVLKDYEDNVFDAVCCDPPYGLSFMGKRWDYDVPSAALWREVLRVCKPGAPLIAFSGTRTYHRTVVQIEDAGWEIRDQLAWMYGSGFPKSLDVSKAIDKDAGAERVRNLVPTKQGNSARRGEGEQGVTYGDAHGGFRDASWPVTALAAEWHGYGTALKPAYEPAVLARKPLDGTVAENVQRWGVGALAIDACRIGDEVRFNAAANKPGGASYNMSAVGMPEDAEGRECVGRWPANVILDEAAGAALDAQTGNRPGMSGGGRHREGYDGGMFGAIDGNDKHARNDQGGASRFFYCAKASRAERDAGCEDLPARTGGEATDREDDSPGTNSPRAGAGHTGGARNFHPTVKPIALMTYLAKLVMPPKPGVILVPFSGSGSEMIGALKAGWPAVVGIERESSYVEIAQRRLKHWAA